VETEQYKDTPQDTLEHQELVQKVKEAFIYESNLIYADAKANPVQLGLITIKGDKTRGLLTVTEEEYHNYTAEHGDDPLESTLELGGEINPLLREVLEGYAESDTESSYAEFLYREYTSKDIWLVKETTEILFMVAAPEGKKLYTYVNMKNGEYGIRARAEGIELRFGGPSAPVLSLPAFVLDGVKVTVRGSMYDDRN
jgi:hypothetical protein